MAPETATLLPEDLDLRRRAAEELAQRTLAGKPAVPPPVASAPTARPIAAEAPAPKTVFPNEMPGQAPTSLGAVGGLNSTNVPAATPNAPVPGPSSTALAAQPTDNFLSALYRKRVEEDEARKANHWGTEGNHPGFLGKLGHVLATAGNIAGDIVAPGVMANIPGTQMHNALAERKDLAGYETAKAAEDKSALEKAQEERARLTTGNKWEPYPGVTGPGGEAMERNELGQTRVAPGVQFKPDENKAPISAEGVTQHNNQLGTLTTGMTPQEQQAFEAAYGVTDKDEHGVATKRLEDAKAAATLSAGERDRKLQRDIANRNHQDQQNQLNENRALETVQYRDKDGQLVTGSYEEAKAAGGTGIRKTQPGDEQKARTAYTQYGRMIDNAQSVEDTMAAWDNPKDKELAIRLKNNFFEHAVIPGVGINPEYVNALQNSDDYKSLTELGQQHMQNMFTLYSDAINVMKQETGGVPRGEQFLKVEGAILPDPTKTQVQNYQAIHQFDQRIRKDASEYARPSDMGKLSGVVPHDAQGTIKDNKGRMGYRDKNGKDVWF